MGNNQSLPRMSRNSSRSNGKPSVFDLLLLGAESANTSRILRQIEYQHITSTHNDLSQYIISIRKTTVSSIIKLFTKSQTLYRFNPKSYQKFNLQHIDANKIKFLQSALAKLTDTAWLNNTPYLTKMSESIQYLWSLDAIQSCWELVYSSNMEIAHFMDQIDTIFTNPHYIPSYNDIMYLPYSNISEVSLTFYKTQMNIVTMNSKKYSKKWLRSFDHATGIIFVVTLSDFDKYLRVQNENALIHSLNLFEKIVNEDTFNQTPIMLIFDQYDVFESKINNGSSISSLFKEYVDKEDRDQNMMKSLQFIKDQFMNRIHNKAPARNIYHHTTAYYGNNFHQIDQIFKDVQHLKVSKNLDLGGLL